MDALLLTNDTYVCEQYHDIEVERHRKHHVAPAHKAGGHPGPWPNGANHHATMHIPKQIRSQTQQQAMQRVHALDALSCVSHLDKKLAVLQAILSDVQQNSADAWAVAPDEEEEAGSAVNATAATTTTLHDSILKEAFNPVPFKELSLPLQLGLRLFFRVCQSFRDPAKLSSSYRMLVPVASKIPEIVAALPLIPLSPGLIDSPVDDDDATGHANSLAGESEPKVYSVFQELFQLLSSLLDLPTTTNAASAMGTATQGDRAILLTAYIALSLKWGRMQHLLVAIQMLLDSSSGLSSAQLEQLAPVLQELACATAELGPSIQREEDVCSGILMSFGKGDHGKLGHGQCNHASCPEGNCTENKNSPTILVATRDVQFVKIDSLSTHSVAITTKGEVMAWGNGDKYRLGHGTTAKEYTPRTIDFLSAKGRVTDIACGLGHTIALLSNGEMYAWGNGSNGRLGLGDTNDRSAPTRVPLPDVVDNSSGGNARALAAVFRSVYCGASHSLGVTRDGRAFAWGKNNQGQCGHGHTNDVYTIEEIRYFPDEADELVAHAAGGWEHTLFCTTSGRVYSCGCGYKDSRRTGIPPVLGHGDCDRRLKPAVVQALVDQNEEAVRVACGWDHSMAVTAQGAVYSWGSGSNGKLGHNDEENYDVPTLIRALEGKTVKDAKAGCEHSVLLTDQNEVFTCGQGDSGRLGHGDAQTRKVPTLIESFADGGLEPVAIAVGDKYNLVLVEDISHTGNAAKDSAGSPRRAPPVSPASRKKASLTTLKHHDPAIVQAYRDRALVRDIQNQFIWGEATKENEANPKCLLIEAIEALCQRRHKSDTVNPEESRDSVLVHKNNVELAGAMLGHMERIAVGYLADEKLGLVGSSMGNSPKGGRAQALLPFAVDTSCESLQSLLGLLRTLAAGVMTDSKGKNDTPSDCQMKALRGPMLLASLRILKTNLDVIVHQHGGEKGRIPSGLALSCAASGKKSSSSDLEMSALFHDLHDFLGSLARSRQEGIVKSLSPVADESKLLFETRKLHQVAAEITEESAQALKVSNVCFL
ncbi:TPA: hypothetical protein N0F65_010377 [Lagenidium giganteum]|uniref:RCC1-like domain-containing protein n=1 Tax=Lagenidium giganteum TaxID=4803 RepID=A0AAV2YLD7_9STRA|nr:TPA: hypothetical protein N0F65_010377 [Lagenidium giganteum]